MHRVQTLNSHFRWIESGLDALMHHRTPWNEHRVDAIKNNIIECISLSARSVHDVLTTITLPGPHKMQNCCVSKQVASEHILDLTYGLD